MGKKTASEGGGSNMVTPEGLPICPLDKRRFKEGRGQGDGVAYIPWVFNHDEPRSGFATRIKGVVTGREHHFQNDGTTDYFRIVDVCPTVRDIKEKFPLSLDVTVKIASALGIEHPRDSASGAYRVMTTEFLIAVVDGLRTRSFARAYLKSNQLQKATVLESLEIERQYWRLRRIDWGIVTEEEVSPTVVANAKLIHSPYHAANLEADYDGAGVRRIPDELIRRIAAILTPGVLQAQAALNSLTQQCDEQLGVRPGISLSVAMHLLAQREWPVDFLRPLEPWAPVPLLKSQGRGVNE